MLHEVLYSTLCEESSLCYLYDTILAQGLERCEFDVLLGPRAELDNKLGAVFNIMLSYRPKGLICTSKGALMHLIQSYYNQDLLGPIKIN